MRRYRDNMTPEDTAALLAEVEALDAAYAAAEEMDAANTPRTEDEWEEAAAADEQSLDYFNRYVAGDR